MYLRGCGRLHGLFARALMVADVLAQHCQQQDIHACARRENEAGNLHDKTETGGGFAREGDGFAHNRRCGAFRSRWGGFFRSRLGERMGINVDAGVRGFFCGGAGWRECIAGVKILTGGFYGSLGSCRGFLDICRGFLSSRRGYLGSCWGVLGSCWGGLGGRRGGFGSCRGLISGSGCFVRSVFFGRRCLCPVGLHGNTRCLCSLNSGRRSCFRAYGRFFGCARCRSRDGINPGRQRGAAGHIFSRVVYEAQIARADGREDQHHRHYGQQRLPALYHCCFISFHSNQTDLRKAAQITASSYQPSERRRLRFSLR